MIITPQGAFAVGDRPIFGHLCNVPFGALTFAPDRLERAAH